MRIVFDRAEPREKRRVNEAPEPEKAVSHALLRGVHANGSFEAFDRNFAQIAEA